MANIILQPAGNAEALRRFEEGIRNPVEVEKIISHLYSLKEIQNLREFSRAGRIPVWGVVPDKRGLNVKNWEKICPGDVALFYAKGQIFASGVMSFKLHNRDLALKLWGQTEGGNTMEYMYFLDQIEYPNIPIRKFNEIAGYAPGFIIRSFSMLNEPESMEVLSAFDLYRDLDLSRVSESDSPTVNDLEFSMVREPGPQKAVDLEPSSGSYQEGPGIFQSDSPDPPADRFHFFEQATASPMDIPGKESSADFVEPEPQGKPKIFPWLFGLLSVLGLMWIFSSTGDKNEDTHSENAANFLVTQEGPKFKIPPGWGMISEDEIQKYPNLKRVGLKYGLQLAGGPKELTYPYILIGVKKGSGVAPDSLNIYSRLSLAEIENIRLQNFLYSGKKIWGEKFVDPDRSLLWTLESYDIEGAGPIIGLLVKVFPQNQIITVYSYCKMERFDEFLTQFVEFNQSILPTKDQ